MTIEPTGQYFISAMKRLIFLLIVLSLLSPSMVQAVERAPRITDREIVERLTRLEEGQKNLNKRIDDLDAKLNKRIDDLDAKLSKRIDDTNKRIDDLRSEMNSRFDTLQWMFGIYISISLIILGFVLRMQWLLSRRQTAMESTLEAQQKDLEFIKSIIEKLLPPKGVL